MKCPTTGQQCFLGGENGACKDNCWVGQNKNKTPAERAQATVKMVNENVKSGGRVRLVGFIDLSKRP